jgi:hypothetical protein
LPESHLLLTSKLSLSIDLYRVSEIFTYYRERLTGELHALRIREEHTIDHIASSSEDDEPESNEDFLFHKK